MYFLHFTDEGTEAQRAIACAKRSSNSDLLWYSTSVVIGNMVVLVICRFITNYQLKSINLEAEINKHLVLFLPVRDLEAT